MDKKTNMEKYVEIRNQYYNEWKAAEAASDAARIRSAELTTAGFEAKKARYKAGEDQPAPAENEWKSALSAEKEAQDAERHARLAFYIAHDDAKRATLEYLREAAAEILIRYTGKAYGEKTRDKIAASRPLVTAPTGFFKEGNKMYFIKDSAQTALFKAQLPKMLRAAGWRERDIMSRAAGMTTTHDNGTQVWTIYTKPDEDGRRDTAQWHTGRECWTG